MKNENSKRKKQGNVIHSLVLMTVAVFLLTPAVPVAAQSSSSNPWTNTFSNIYDYTRTWNRDLWDAQKRLNDVTSGIPRANSSQKQSSSTSYGRSPQSMPPMRQYSITATDFPSVSRHLLPDQLANAATGLKPEEREELRGLYRSILNSFEREARKNNMANAFAFVVGVSLQEVTGRQLTELDSDKLIAYFNSSLVNIPQYNALEPGKKQILYESLVLTGGIIGFLQAKGNELNDAQMQAQAKELSKAVLKQFLGINV
jgi:hypothetical protein